MFEEADLIHRYTRVNALRYGVLIGVSAAAREAGITYPVALTCAAWARCVAVPPGVECQDEAGRLWDALWLLACAVRHVGSGPEVLFGTYVRNDNREGTPPRQEVPRATAAVASWPPARGGWRGCKRRRADRPPPRASGGRCGELTAPPGTTGA
jgi:hypothetical protein